MQLITAPQPLKITCASSVFLAGSIEMGKAEPWQDMVIELLREEDVTVLNPRRPDWDSSWRQHPSNTQFRKQVEWELKAQAAAKNIFFYFQPGTVSPISLLELGLCASRGDDIIVCCPEDFHRFGNVAITCEIYGVWFFTKLDAALKELVEEIRP